MATCGIPRLWDTRPAAGQGRRRTEGPNSLAGNGALGMQTNNAAQALGLRPWLAALPLRERRLRARLLMSAPNGGLSSVMTAIVTRPGSIPGILAQSALRTNRTMGTNLVDSNPPQIAAERRVD